MKAAVGAAALFLTAALLPGHADAAGCLKGAVVGGVAGHFAGNHGALGAGAGCLVGRHHANKKAQQQMNGNGGSGSSTNSQDQNQNQNH
jgi:hypothetical protein